MAWNQGKKQKNRGNRVEIPKDKPVKPLSWAVIVLLLFTGVLTPVAIAAAVWNVYCLHQNKQNGIYRSYMAIIGDRDEVDIHEIAAKKAEIYGQAVNDLQAMIDKGYLGANAYLDHSRGMVVLGTEAETVRPDSNSEQRTSDSRPGPKFQRKKAKPEQKPEPEPAASPKEEPETSAQEDFFESTLRQMRSLNEEIENEEVSACIDRIGCLTASIFNIVREKPERANEVKKFMNYYLPTTFKLLQSYSLMEKQSYQGENIQASRKKIEDIMHSLVTAFEQLQDQLFRTDALNIDADIQVLETMMAKDGLVTPKGMDLHAAASQKQK